MLSLLVACTYRAYDGAQLAPSERATIEAAVHFYVVAAEGVQITSINGKRLPRFIDDIELAPGFHYISVKYGAQYGQFEKGSVRDCVIEFEADAGHDYFIDFAARDGRWSAWLLDAMSKEPIADCSWTAAPIYSWTPKPTPTPTVAGAWVEPASTPFATRTRPSAEIR
jgi:hypothetical protein